MTALNEKAILVSVKTKKFTATVKNREATAEFATDKQTTSEWVNITQRLVAKSVIDGPRKIAERGKHDLRGVSPGEFDGEFLRGGLPYWGQNVHILPNTLSDKVLRNLGAFQEKFTEAVEVVRKALPDALKQAAIENPLLANQVAMPDVDTICDEKFQFEWQLDVIPSSDDIRVDASKEFVDELKRSVQGRADRKLQEVTQHSVMAVIKGATHLAKSCEDYDPQKKGKSPFRDSAVNQVRELIPVIRGLNINADAAIDKAATDLLAAVGNKSANDLRADGEVRKDVASQARKVASSLDSLFN